MTQPRAGRGTTPAGGMYRRIARNSALFAGGTATSSLFMMLSVAVAARALPAREFGVLVLLQSAALMLRAIATFSTQQPVIKLGSDAQAAEDKDRIGRVISMGLLVDIAASVIAFGIAAIGIEFSRAAIGLAAQDVGSAWILAVSLPFTGYPTSNGIFRLYNRFGLLSLVQTLSAVALFAGYAVLFITGAKLQAFVWAWALYLSASNILQLWLSLHLVHRDKVALRFRRNLFSGADGRTFLHYCWSTWGTSTADTARTNGDSLLIGAIVSVEAAGLYNVARQLAGVLRKFIVVYSSTVFPEIARLVARGDFEGERRLRRRMLWAGLGIAIPAIGLAAIFGHPVVQLLFGARFGSAYWPFVVLTAAAAGQLISQTPSMCVQVIRGPRHVLYLYVVATLVFAVAAIALTFAWSITGMALAQLLFAIVFTLLCELALRRRSPPKPSLERQTSPSDYPELDD